MFLSFPLFCFSTIIVRILLQIWQEIHFQMVFNNHMNVHPQSTVYCYQHMNNKIKQWIKHKCTNKKKLHSKYTMNVKRNKSFKAQDTWQTWINKKNNNKLNDVILIWRLYLPGVEPGISRSTVGTTTAASRRSCIKLLMQTLRGVAVVVLTVDREFPDSTPGRRNLQIEITSKSWSCGPWLRVS